MDWTGFFGNTVKRDELQAAGAHPVSTFNINVEEDAVLKRGDLVAGANPTDTFKIATAADTGKFYGIIREDFEASTDSATAQAYISGDFHLNRLNNIAVASALETDLIRQGINLTVIKGR